MLMGSPSAPSVHRFLPSGLVVEISLLAALSMVEVER